MDSRAPRAPREGDIIRVGKFALGLSRKTAGNDAVTPSDTTRTPVDSNAVGPPLKHHTPTSCYAGSIKLYVPTITVHCYAIPLSIAAQAETTPSSIPVSANAPQGRFATPITPSPSMGPREHRRSPWPVEACPEALEGPVLRAHEGGPLATLTRTPRTNANAPATLPSWNTHARIWNSTSPPLSRRGARRPHSPSPGSCGRGPRQRGVVAPLQKNL